MSSVESRIASLESQVKSLQSALKGCVTSLGNNVLTGHLQLMGDPQGDLEPATKHYVDTILDSTIDTTIILAKTTTGGTLGSIRVKKGIVVQYTAPT